MIHGYHVILPMYGFWLPNDPRGSWSDFVRKWELLKFGSAQPSSERREISQLTKEELRIRKEARKALSYPPVSIDGDQALSIGKGFSKQTRTSNYTIWACSILPTHTHLVIARHTYSVEQICNLLKGAATRQLVEDGVHPLAEFASPEEKPPRAWSAKEWKVYLDSEEEIEDAICYVEQNPIKEGKPQQTWSFVTPFGGLPQGGWISYH